MKDYRPLFLDADPSAAARCLDDALLDAQLTRCAAALDWATFPADPDPSVLDLSNAVLARWARATRPAYRWLLGHCLAALSEWSDRFGGVHPASPVVHRALGASGWVEPSLGGGTVPRLPGFPRSAPVRDSLVVARDRRGAAYRWLNASQSRQPAWTRAVAPRWFR